MLFRPVVLNRYLSRPADP